MNAQIYNLIFVPQVIHFLLEDAIISGKATRIMVARSKRQVVVKWVKLEIIKQCQ